MPGQHFCSLTPCSLTRPASPSAPSSLCFASLQVILGTQYAGEMKKGVFSLMNYVLPKMGILSLHSGCNEGKDGDVTLFFGLSGGCCARRGVLYLDCTSILLCTAGDERSCDLATSGVCALPPVWLGEITLLNSRVERPFLAPLTTPQAPARPRCLPTRSGR